MVTESNGKRVDITAKSADVLRQQPDGTWRFVLIILGEQTNVTELLHAH